MGLFSFFKPQTGATPAAGADAAQVVADARTRAKRRLLGAVVLLGIGVLAFPLLFETQPRPIPVDIAIEIPRKDGAPPLVVPPARQAPVAQAAKPAQAATVIPERKAEAAKEVAAPAPAQPKPEPAPKAAEAAPKAAVVAKPDAKPPPAAAARPPAEVPGRFVVQIGAFSDDNAVRETRAKVEKLGLRTYTQSLGTKNGKLIRVRLGPFASRDEADRAAAKVKAAGLQADVLTL